MPSPVRPARPAALVILALVGAGCSRSDAATRVVARVDTLPSGVIEVTSDQPTGWRDAARAWSLVEAARVAPEDGTPGELVEPQSIGVDGAGRIYVVDTKPAVIKVYDSTGAFVRTIGGEGSGPGEFKVGFMAVKGGTIVLHDPQQGRTSVFDTTGAFARSWVSSCCYWTDISIDDSDRVYIPTMTRPDSTGRSRGSAYTRYRLDGVAIDTAWVPRRDDDAKSWVFASKSKDGKNRSMMSTPVPFTARLMSTFHPAGGFVEGWTGDYRLIRSRTGEDTTAIYQRAWAADEIPETMRQQEVDDMVKNARNMVGEEAARSIARLEDIPTKAPAFVTLRVDLDGNIWARRLIGSDSTRTSYDVFGPDGAWLGGLVVPFAVPEWGGQFFGRGAIYAATEGADGRPVIVKLRIRQAGP